MIHKTAIVDKKAKISAKAIIGPYSIVGPNVEMGEGAEIQSHVNITGNTIIGNNTKIFPFASIGTNPQDLKYKGGSPGVKIGDNNTIREYVTINAATYDGDYTIVKNNCLIMAYSHIAHCCNIGNQVIIANAVQIAGHVTVEDQATIEGMVGIVQFLRIGRMAFVGGLSKVSKDLPPFMIAHGDPIGVRGFNKIGMERKGCSEESKKSIKEAYRILYRSKESTSSAIIRLENEIDMTDELRSLIDFCKSSSKGIIR